MLKMMGEECHLSPGDSRRSRLPLLHKHYYCFVYNIKTAGVIIFYSYRFETSYRFEKAI